MSKSRATATAVEAPRRRVGARIPWRDVTITAIAFVLAFLVGAIVMIVSDASIVSKYSYFFARPGDALGASWTKVSTAYSWLTYGALGGWQQLTMTTAQAAPLIAAGLGVALAFRASLFNIGGQGQATMAAIVAAWAGFALNLPPVIHLIVAVLAGLAAGAAWGGIVGWLKSRTGANEVIVTIMLNYVATGLLAWLLTTKAFLRPGQTQPLAPFVHPEAAMPRVPGSMLHLGFFLSLLLALLVWWILERSTIGFQIRAVGSNADAASTAGMSVGRTMTVAMVLSGALCGFAGVLAVLAPQAGGQPAPLSAGIVGTVGFDAITVALLGRSKPLGTVLAGLLFGAMHAGGLAMQSFAQTPAELTNLLQALIVMFVAAPRLVEALLPFLKTKRHKPTAAELAPIAKGVVA